MSNTIQQEQDNYIKTFMITYKLNHVDGLYFELTGDEGKNREYDVSFVDRKGKVEGMLTDQQVTIYETKMKPGSWSKLNRKYLSDISIFVKYQGRTVTQINLLDHSTNGSIGIWI